MFIGSMGLDGSWLRTGAVEVVAVADWNPIHHRFSM